jgi:hypothetical protein
MSLKLNAFLAVMLATICFGCSRHQNVAQNTTPESTPPVFVPMPDDIQCGFHDATREMHFDKSGDMVGAVVSVKKVTCQIAGQNSKEIPLASTDVTDGLLSTKDFSEWKLTTGSGPSSAISIAMRGEKLQSFKAYLQK